LVVALEIFEAVALEEMGSRPAPGDFSLGLLPPSNRDPKIHESLVYTGLAVDVPQKIDRFPTGSSLQGDSVFNPA
jgi:hypothetical protein